MRLTTYLMKLIQTNSGASSKAFFLVSVTIIGCLLLLTIGFVLLYEVLTTNTIHTDPHGHCRSNRCDWLTFRNSRHNKSIRGEERANLPR